MSKKYTELKVIEETSKIIEDIEKGFYEILANHTMKVCMSYEEELTKYKRAFEILKKVVIVSKLDGTYLLSVWANKLMPDPVCYLEKEQGELLEEIMKDDN